MPAPYTSGQPSNSRRHPTCWASSQWSHTVSSTPCHEAWTPAPLSARPSIECKRTAPRIETPICTRRTTSHQFIWQKHTCGAVGGSPMKIGVDGQPHKIPYFHPRHRHPSTPEWPSQEEPGSGLTGSAPVSDVSAPACTNGVWPPLQRYGLLYEWGMASSAACECGAEEPTVDHVVLQCPVHRPPHGLHGLTVLDNETIEWLLNTCPEI